MSRDLLYPVAPMMALLLSFRSSEPYFGRRSRARTWAIAVVSAIVILAILLAIYFFVIAPAPTGTTTIHS